MKGFLKIKGEFSRNFTIVTQERKATPPSRLELNPTSGERSPTHLKGL